MQVVVEFRAIEFYAEGLAEVTQCEFTQFLRNREI